MTEEQPPADLQETEARETDVQETPADSATADALESVSATEQPVDPAPTSAGDEADYLEPGQTAVAVEPEVVIDDDTMRRALEAILMVTDEPLPVLTLARTVGRPTGDISAALTALAEEYTEQGRGFDLREVGGGWRYYTRAEAAQYVERFVLDGQQARLTQAALETLAVVAYKQPVSRARVSAIRGVNVDGVMRTLVSRGLVEEAGADTESQAILYRTSSYFLERMGMQSLDDLPELAPYLPEMDDMEEELAAQTPTPETSDPDATPDSGEAVTSDVGAAAAALDDADLSTNQPTESDTEGDAEDNAEGEDESELEPAEELEAGGAPEVEQDLDPAEIPEVPDTGEKTETEHHGEDADADPAGAGAEDDVLGAADSGWAQGGTGEADVTSDGGWAQDGTGEADVTSAGGSVQGGGGEAGRISEGDDAFDTGGSDEESEAALGDAADEERLAPAEDLEATDDDLELTEDVDATDDSATTGEGATGDGAPTGVGGVDGGGDGEPAGGGAVGGSGIGDPGGSWSHRDDD